MPKPERKHEEYDVTSLRYSGKKSSVHRDYLAHCFRWGWAARAVHTKGFRRIIEPGCGYDSPLHGYLNSTRGLSFRPELYLGADLGPIAAIKAMRASIDPLTRCTQLRENFNFVERYQELLDEFGQTFDLPVSFEVIEHMTEDRGDEYLQAINKMLIFGGSLFISTPVFNGHAAANHIREYTIPELQEKLERNGFEIKKRIGTFASYHDAKRGIAATYEPAAAAVIQGLYDELRGFYGDDVLACFLAPVIPDYSRNNVWVVQKT